MPFMNNLHFRVGNQSDLQITKEHNNTSILIKFHYKSCELVGPLLLPFGPCLLLPLYNVSIVARLHEMALPDGYTDYCSYFRALLAFLSEYHWLFDFPMTQLLVCGVLDRIPADWRPVLASRDTLNRLPSSTNADWPPSLVSFCERCVRLPLRPQLSPPPATLPARLLCGLTPKKQHEVARLTTTISAVCSAANTTNILDVGSGLGYVDRTLHHFSGFCILGLEANAQHVASAKKLNLSLFPRCDSVNYVQCDISYANLDCIARVMQFFFGSKQSTMENGKGLCGDLNQCRNDGTNIFADNFNSSVCDKCVFRKLDTVNKTHDFHIPNDVSSEIDYGSDCHRLCFCSKQNCNRANYPSKASSSVAQLSSKELINSKCISVLDKWSCPQAEMNGPTETFNDPYFERRQVYLPTPGKAFHTKMKNVAVVQPSNHIDKVTQNTVRNEQGHLIKRRKGCNKCRMCASSKENEGTCMIGLHACGDLAASSLQLFLALPSIASLVLVPCCYIKMSLSYPASYKQFEPDVLVPSAELKLNVCSEDSGSIPILVSGKQPESSAMRPPCHANSQSQRKRSDFDKSAAEGSQNLTEQQPERFEHFPISATLSAVLEDVPEYRCFLRRPLLRLATQETVSRCLNRSHEKHDRHALYLLSRAILQLYVENEGLQLRKMKRRGVRKSVLKDFATFLDDVLERYEIHDSLGAPTDLTEAREALEALWLENCGLAGMGQAVAVLQLCLQSVCESLVLADRIAYLRENGIVAPTLVTIADETISPRCLALVANK